jgi:hypothetical protein
MGLRPTKGDGDAAVGQALSPANPASSTESVLAWFQLRRLWESVFPFPQQQPAARYRAATIREPVTSSLRLVEKEKKYGHAQARNDINQGSE